MAGTDNWVAEAGMINSKYSDKTLVYTSQQVRELDRIAIQDQGIPGYTLMQRAGQALFAQLQAHWPTARSVCVLCGAGNNAGDGYVVARLALEQGWQVNVLALCTADELRGDAATACRDYTAKGGALNAFTGTLPLPTVDLWVDALLGTGLTRAVDGVYADAIQALNRQPTPVIAVDVPSGLDADSGCMRGCAVQADLTVTFIGHKQGLLTGQAWAYTGELVLDELALPASVYAQLSSDMYLLSEQDIACHLPARSRTAHKGQFGHSLLVGGMAGMSGAIRLAGEAALRTGSGRVTLATDPVHADWLNLTRPELMVHPLDSAMSLRRLTDGKQALGIGPGLGQSVWSRQLLISALALAATANIPLVLDADALNLLAGMHQQSHQWVLTPHPAEAARLLACTTAEIEQDRVAAARELQKRYGGVIVLKGAGTLVASSESIAFCQAGNPGMSTAGMGDVLTGIITALLAQGLPLFQAAATGVQVHARAGDLAALDGERGLLASDVINNLRKVINP